MADVRTYNALINALSANQGGDQAFDGYLQTAGTAFAANTNGTPSRNIACTKAISLPGSTTKVRMLYATAYPSVSNHTYMICKMVNLGSLDISGASGTFTDGSTMPTRTELGTANSQTYGPVFCEVTTVLNAAPGTLSVTYKNQAGTGSRTFTFALTGSASVHAGMIVNLQAGDFGCSDITAASRSAGTTPSGVIKFWGLLPICFLSTLNSITTGINIMTGGSFNFPELGANDVIGIVNITTSTVAGRETGRLWFFGEA